MEDVQVIELEDQNEEEFQDEEEESEDDEDDDNDDDYEEELIPSVETSPRVSHLVPESDVTNSAKWKFGNVDGDDEFKGFEIDGLYCPICTDAWTSGGDHQICNPEGSSSSTPDVIAAQLAVIASKLESMESLQADVAALKTRAMSRDKGSGCPGRMDDGETSWNNSRSHRPKNKTSFPVFSDGDPRGWILKVEKYFRYYNIPDEEKVDVASMHLEGDALDLYSWLSSDQDICYWEELVRALQKNFGPAEFQNPDEHLCSIRQTGTVQEYRHEFAKRSSRVANWPEHCLLGVFLNGLKDDLKADVRIHKPRTVYKAMSIALEFESKLCITRTGKGLSASTNFKPVSAENEPASTLLTEAVTTSKPPARISETEKQNRLLRGECFRCGDKYRPGHKCQTRAFKLIELTADMEEQHKEDGPEDLAEISLHALFGQSTTTTMKLKGILELAEVLVLIDSGSTHNFISDKLVNDLKITAQFITPFGVQIGNGDVIRCNRVCRNVQLQLGDLQVIQDLYPFALGGADVVLGIKWLATLNTVQANWQHMSLAFTIDDKEYKLQGLPLDDQQAATFQHLTNEPFELHTTGTGALFSVTRLGDKSVLWAGCIDKNPRMETGHNGSGHGSGHGSGQTHLLLHGGKLDGEKTLKCGAEG